VPQPAILVYNPRAGRFRSLSLVDPVLAELAAAGLAAEAQATRAPGHAAAIARRAAELGAPAVLVLGGDGTLREAAAGLLGSRTALGIVPAGTTNVAARALGVPLEARRAARALAGASPRELDVGLCGTEPFLIMASGSFDAEVLRGVPAGAKRIFGRVLVGACGLARWLGWRAPTLDLVADEHMLSASFFAVCNLPLYAGPFTLAPGARADDGRLDLVLFHGETRRALMGFALAMVRGRAKERRDVAQFPVGEVRLPGRHLVQLDGDWREVEEATIRLAPQRLRMLVPSLPDRFD
jgi:YegS/Rv2252/BmrU family lipid kinase